MSDCEFCGIAADEAPASVVHEDETSVAFLNVEPDNPGHALVVPREHAPGLADLPEETGGHLFRVGMRLADALRDSGFDPDGINLSLADGDAAGQEVGHVHLHVVPRHEGDDVRYTANRASPSRDELDEVAAEIRTSL